MVFTCLDANGPIPQNLLKFQSLSNKVTSEGALWAVRSGGACLLSVLQHFERSLPVNHELIWILLCNVLYLGLQG